MKVFSASARRILSLITASGLILAFTILPLSSAMAQGNAAAGDGIPPLPLSPVERAQQDGTALPLSLTEFTKLVLQNNLDIAIQDLNEENRRQSLLSAYGAYDPTLSLNTSIRSSRTVSTNNFDTSGTGTTISDSFSYGLTYRQPLKSGGSITVSHSPSRSATNSNMSAFNPSYSGNLQVQYSQNLWRNLRIDNARNQIKIANLDLQLSDVQFKRSVTNTIANVQQQYWDLVSAIRNYEIQRNSLRVRLINLRDQQRRLEVGTIPPIDVMTAESSVANQEQSLISAEDRIRRAQNSLRALVSGDRNSDIWKRTIVPTDSPDFREYKIDPDTAVAIALQNRPELEESRISMTQLELRNQLSRESRKWGVNLNASFQTSATAGRFTSDRYKPSLQGGLPTYYKTLFSDPGTTWNVGFTINVPLRDRSLEATLAQQEISKRDNLMRRRQQEQNIQVDVLNALQALETARRQVDAAAVALRTQRAQYEAEVKRNEAGLSQNYRVLEVEQQLSSQEYSQLTALINYKQAVTTLQRTMFNLLEASDFSIARGSSSNIPNFR